MNFIYRANIFLDDTIYNSIRCLLSKNEYENYL